MPLTADRPAGATCEKQSKSPWLVRRVIPDRESKLTVLFYGATGMIWIPLDAGSLSSLITLTFNHPLMLGFCFAETVLP
jgi:hypothetical protein